MIALDKPLVHTEEKGNAITVVKAFSGLLRKKELEQFHVQALEKSLGS